VFLILSYGTNHLLNFILIFDVLQFWFNCVFNLMLWNQRKKGLGFLNTLVKGKSSPTRLLIRMKINLTTLSVPFFVYTLKSMEKQKKI